MLTEQQQMAFLTNHRAETGVKYSSHKHNFNGQQQSS